MKAAVSIPDDVFNEAEALASELKTSRSQLYSRALREFLARHAPDRVTESYNQVCDDLGEAASLDPALRSAAKKALLKTEW